MPVDPRREVHDLLPHERLARYQGRGDQGVERTEGYERADLGRKRLILRRRRDEEREVQAASEISC